ncbi:unnamed protein product [Schistosoma rodhaini]|nr:unnamed protein product [Schistosoma rodhaini]
MKYTSQILLLILLIIVNLHCSFSLSCYECLNCPDPFENSSLVQTKHNCVWCAKLMVGDYKTPIRECTPNCTFQFWSKKYLSLSYYCCQTNYCNTSVKTCINHHMLTVIVVTLTCFFRVKMK